MTFTKDRRDRHAIFEPLESRVFFSVTEVARNGGFEGTVASADWVRTGNFQADSRFNNPRTGDGYAYLSNTNGTAGNSLSGSMYQLLTIPASATSATLSFWTRVTTSETSTTAANDTMTAVITDAGGATALQPIASLSNLDASGGYVRHEVALPAGLIGQSVRVLFTAATDATLPTTFRVDDVSLRADVPAETTSSMRVVGYLPYYRQSSFAKLDLSMLTHINYFSIQATDSGALSTPNVNDANLATVVNAMHALGKTVSITVGPQSLSNLAASATARTTFANNLLAYCDARNLDGVDIDWEPPAGNNVANYGLLIDELYRVLKPSGKILTAAVNPWTNEIPAAAVNAKMDWLNVMCYDFAPANHSTYDHAVSGMVDWTNYGVTKDKIVMGMPFYGKSGTSWSNDVSKTYGAILADYRTINGVYPGPDVDSYVDSTGATYYFNGFTTIQQKAAYVRDNGYGGAMIWELGQDWFNPSTNKYDSMSLLPAINSILRPPGWLEGDAGSRFNYLNHSLSVTAGNVRFVGDASASDPTLAVSVAAGASASFNVSQKFSSLSVAGTARLPAGGNKTLVTGGLSVTGAGKLDLADNDLVVRYAPGAGASALANVEALVKRGYSSGTWLGGGVTSSAAAADANGLTALGYLNNADLGRTEFGGVTGLTGNEILVKHTYYGDADLSGVVNTDDFAQFLYGFQNPVAQTWLNGDFDYNGVVNTDDFAQFLFAYQSQRAPL